MLSQMTVEEARAFLLEKREKRGRPPVEWTSRKREALKIVAEFDRSSKEVSPASISPASMMEEKVEKGSINLEPDPRISEALSALNPSNIDW